MLVMSPRCCSLLSLLAFVSHSQIGHTQISKGNQILIDRGFQIQGIVSTYDTFHLSTFSNANYTTVNWLWSDPRCSDIVICALARGPPF